MFISRLVMSPLHSFHEKNSRKNTPEHLCHGSCIPLPTFIELRKFEAHGEPWIQEHSTKQKTTLFVWGLFLFLFFQCLASLISSYVGPA